MVLMITLGGVVSLLRRNVFIPIKLLIDFTDRIIKGQSYREFPPCSSEMEKLAGNIRQIAQDLNSARQEIEKLNKGE
jgi:HAMP domain-containing protein